MKTDFEFLTTEIDGHILTVTINRPEVMNALHPPAHAEFDEVWNEFDKDEDLWVGIVTGAGDRAFSAGNDLKFQAQAGGDPSDAELKLEFDRIGTALENRHFEESLVVGRVFELQKEPRGLLERVRTGWKGEEFGKDAQMPGSATNGFSDLITLSDERIADEIVIVNVKIQ